MVKLDLDVIKNFLNQFNKDLALIKSTIEDKRKTLEEDRAKLMPLLMKEESGETTEEDNTVMEKLQERIDY